jgi:hypothetical protein
VDFVALFGYKQDSDEWPILRRWDVPWGWQTLVLSVVGCGVRYQCAPDKYFFKNYLVYVCWLVMFICAWLSLRKYPERSLDSFALTGLVEQSALQYLGYSAAGATIDEKAGILFLGQLYGSLLTRFVC